MDRLFQQFYDLIFQFHPDMIVFCDPSGLVKEGNRMAAHFLQKKGSIYHFFHSSSRKEIQHLFEQVRITGEPATFEAVVEETPSSILCLPLYSNNFFYGYALIIRDISKVKEADEKIQYLTQFDDLTKLPNEQATFNRLEYLCQTEKNPAAVVKFQINRYKYINEIFGKDISNEVIKSFARQLRNIFPDTYFIGRLSNDEFLVIVYNVVNKDEMIRDIVHRINKLEDILVINDLEIYYDYSIGIVFYPVHGRTPKTLIKNSEIAIKMGKEKNERIAQFNNHNSKSIERRIFIENELYKAVKKRELCLYYQPIVDTKEKKITGFEVLLRWKHKELGMIPPSEFIPIAEDTGLIVEIGKWSMEKACQQLKEWRDKGFRDLKISVNLSIKQFYQHDVVKMITDYLTMYEIPPECFELEFTETVPMYNFEWFLEIIRKLKKLNIGLSIDDFGTGYSSLSYLTKLKLDKIKIDRSFIQNIYLEHDHNVVVKTIIALAQNLKLSIVAEGVEKKEQVFFLNRHHCFQMQGFYFSKPVSSDEAFQLLQNWPEKKKQLFI